MKMMKLALLGTAALAAVSVSARADDLSDLKAQIEALKADVAALQAAPSVPAGYSLLTVGEAQQIVVPTLESSKFEYGATANNIGILPTADMPASTNIQWSGFVRAAIVYSDFEDSYWTSTSGVTNLVSGSEDHLYLAARGEIKVVGTTDTAVGEVGALVKLRGNFGFDNGTNGNVTMPEAWGWWKMTPELTFGGGYTGSLSTINHAADNMTAMYSGGLAAGPYGFGDRTQFRLSYASGPLSAAIALTSDNDHASIDELGVEGEIKYSGDAFSIEVAGGFANGFASAVSSTVSMENDSWKVGVGATMNLSEMFSLQLGAQIGSNDLYAWFAPSPFYSLPNGDQDYWVVSGLIVAALSESISAELGASYMDYEGTWVTGGWNHDGKTVGVAAGLYYTPVSQLTLGVEGAWNKTEESFSPMPSQTSFGSTESETMTVDFVSVFRF